MASGPFDSSGNGLADELVPAGATRGLLCAYAGLNPQPRDFGDFKGRRRLAGRRLVHLRATLNSLPAPLSGPSSCGNDDGSAFVVLFGYPGRPPVAVTVNVPNTCFVASNGHKDAFALDALAELRRLARHSS